MPENTGSKGDQFDNGAYAASDTDGGTGGIIGCTAVPVVV